MKIFLDASGGDLAYKSNIEGAVMAVSECKDLTIVLGGSKEEIINELDTKEYDKSRIIIEDCQEFISNSEQPVFAVRKKNNSAIVRGMLMLKDRQVDAFISAGSTGAVLAAGMFRLGRIKGIERPAIAPLIPHGNGYFLLIDSGANVDCTPTHLKHFAIMGNAYMHSVMNINNPRIGLVNIGAEEEKGDELRKNTYQILKSTSLNFVGNIEARDIVYNKADVIVCDGFVGNVILKLMEGFSKKILKLIKSELMISKRTKIGGVLAKPAFKNLKSKFDYKEVGGAPLLGVDGCVVKAHGSSDSYAIYSSIKQAMNMATEDVANTIKERIFLEENYDI